MPQLLETLEQETRMFKWLYYIEGSFINTVREVLRACRKTCELFLQEFCRCCRLVAVAIVVNDLQGQYCPKQCYAITKQNEREKKKGACRRCCHRC